jgi:hypothetical protein
MFWGELRDFGAANTLFGLFAARSGSLSFANRTRRVRAFVAQQGSHCAETRRTRSNDRAMQQVATAAAPALTNCVLVEAVEIECLIVRFC